jgi:hypothetical protein
VSDEVSAPFTDDQVASLNAYQGAEHWHPFTCGADGCRAVLRAEPDGWRCPSCGHRQRWAHRFMADWSWRRTVR